MALTRNYGRIEHFQPENEKIGTYLEKVKLYFQANDILTGKNVSILLTSIGNKTCTVLRNYFAPTKPASKILDDIMDALK